MITVQKQIQEMRCVEKEVALFHYRQINNNEKPIYIEYRLYK